MHEVEGVQLFVRALHTTMLRSRYDELPDRAALTGLPVHGVTYKDRSHPGLTFGCVASTDWARYTWVTLRPQLVES